VDSLNPIGQTPKADFSIVSRHREKRRKAFAADTKTEKKWDQLKAVGETSTA
jgi:hypothetical protein